MKPFVLDEPVNGTFWPELESPRELGDLGTGYYNVFINRNPRILLGYLFAYIYDMDAEKKDYKTLSSTSILNLEEKVVQKGLPWRIIDEEAALMTLQKNLIDLEAQNMKTSTSSGVKYIHKKAYNNKDYWLYNATIDGKNYQISSRTLSEMYHKIKEYGLPWIVMNRDLYSQNLGNEEVYL